MPKPKKDDYPRGLAGHVVGAVLLFIVLIPYAEGIMKNASPHHCVIDPKFGMGTRIECDRYKRSYTYHTLNFRFQVYRVWETTYVRVDPVYSRSKYPLRLLPADKIAVDIWESIFLPKAAHTLRSHP
jgi:hypothetical protein